MASTSGPPNWDAIFPPTLRYSNEQAASEVFLKLVSFFNNSVGLQLSQGFGQVIQSAMDQADHDFKKLFERVAVGDAEVEPIAESLFATFMANIQGQIPYFEDGGLMADSRWANASMEMALKVWGTLADATLLNVLPGLCVKMGASHPRVHILPLLESINNAIRWNAIIDVMDENPASDASVAPIQKVQGWLTTAGVDVPESLTTDAKFRQWFLLFP